VSEEGGRRGRRRRDDRRRALDALYQADVTGVDPAAVLEEWRLASGEEVAPFTRELVEGVRDRLDEIDATLEARAEGWPVARMAVVDRNVLRLACYELRYRPDVPPAVAIAEAVEAANDLSTEESGRFVNGVLGGLVRDLGESAPDP